MKVEIMIRETENRIQDLLNRLERNSNGLVEVFVNKPKEVAGLNNLVLIKWKPFEGYEKEIR